MDPVATIAIFKALNVDPTLNMLVFGESILNDAVSIVLTKYVLKFNVATVLLKATFLYLYFYSTFQELATGPAKEASKTSAFFFAVGDFLRMMVGSAFLGILIGLVSALISF